MHSRCKRSAPATPCRRCNACLSKWFVVHAKRLICALLKRSKRQYQLVIRFQYRPPSAAGRRTNAKSTTVALAEVGCCRLIRRPVVLTVIIVYHPTGFLYSSYEQIITSRVCGSRLWRYLGHNNLWSAVRCSKQKHWKNKTQANVYPLRFLSVWL